MNCDKFKAVLHEYLDEALDADAHAAVREHLQQCGDCRRAVMREETLAKSILHSLDQVTAGLSLRPEMRRNVLKALESESPQSNAWLLAWRNFISSAARPTRAGAALLCLMLLFFGVQFYRRAAKDPSPGTAVQNDHYALVVHVPIPTQTYVFQHKNNAVVDTFTASVAVGHAGFFEERKTSPRRPPKPL